MPNTNYAQAKLHFRGNPVNKLTSCAWRGESGLQVVNLMNEGLDGFSIGSGSCTIEWSFPIPATGAEHPYETAFVNKEDVDLQYTRGNKSYAGTGKIMTYEESQSDNEVLSGTATWQGKLLPFD
jgi:hypothetical protein